MAANSHNSLAQTLALSALEFLLNQVLTSDPLGRERLAQLDGTVIRVRVEKPDEVIFLLVHADSVEVLTEFDGYVNVRVRGELGALLEWWLVPNSAETANNRLRVLGADDTLQLLQDTISDFSLWALVRGWLDNFTQLEDVLALLKREDSRWHHLLKDLPETVQKMSEEVAQQRLQHEDLEDEFTRFKRIATKERRKDISYALLALICFGLSFAFWERLISLSPWLAPAEQAAAALLLGVLLLLSRLLFSRRYV